MAFVEILATETSEDEGDITMEWYIARVGDYPPLVVFLVFILSLAVLVYARVIILLDPPRAFPPDYCQHILVLTPVLVLVSNSSRATYPAKLECRVQSAECKVFDHGFIRKIGLTELRVQWPAITLEPNVLRWNQS
ncbi:hypothetical protein EV363DRAFT_1298541 [Boletus edulis]|nr:hypothetical protein EV363DRAFT_1298541 [Boletus edulis]